MLVVLLPRLQLPLTTARITHIRHTSRVGCDHRNDRALLLLVLQVANRAVHQSAIQSVTTIVIRQLVHERRIHGWQRRRERSHTPVEEGDALHVGQEDALIVSRCCNNTTMNDAGDRSGTCHSGSKEPHPCRYSDAFPPE